MKKYFKKLSTVLITKVLCSALSIAALAVVPYLHKALFDMDFRHWGKQGLLLLITAYILAYAGNCFFEYISQKNAWKLDRDFNLLIKNDLFRALMGKSYLKFTEKTSGEYLSMFNNDIAVARQYIASCSDVVQYLLQLLVYVTYLLILDWRITIVIAVGAFLTLLSPKITGKTLAERRNIWIRFQGTYTEKLQDLFAGFKEVNNTTRENISACHEKTLTETEDSMMNYGKYSTFTHILNGAFLYAVNIFAFIAVGYLFFTGRITVGTGIASLGYVNTFIDPLRYMLEEISNVKSTKEVTDNLINYLHHAEKQADTPVEKSGSETKSHQKLQLSGIGRKFENFTFHPFSYTFESGKKYAVIGSNGSGKSTLLNLIMGYLPIDEGKIHLNGCEISPEHTEDFIACCTSNSHIFSGSFEENISVFGSYSQTMLSDLISKAKGSKGELLKGNSHAEKFSNGEKQITAFFRALVRDLPIIFLDEPFSALDNENRTILQNLLFAEEDKMVLMVTHHIDYQSLKDFDEVLIFHNGKFTDSGTPQEIILSPAYARLLTEDANDPKHTNE